MLYVLDCGHNFSDTWQKYSPIRENGERYYEYQGNRKIGQLVADKLTELGIKWAWTIKPEDKRDMSLQKRVEVANAYARGEGKEKTLFISFHSNALGKGNEWLDARGWSVWTTPGKTRSDDFATMFYDEASKILPDYGMWTRKDMSDGDPDYEENFYVLKHTICPAILLEQMFYTNKKDLKFLDSDEGRKVLADIVVNTIIKIEEMYK